MVLYGLLYRNEEMIMKISIEDGNTVIRRPFDAEWVRRQIALGNPFIYEAEDGYRGVFHDKLHSLVNKQISLGRLSFKYAVTILPPLPRKPTVDDAPLLHRYMSEGIEAVIDVQGFINTKSMRCSKTLLNALSLLECEREITHAVNAKTGEHVDVAITDREG